MSGGLSPSLHREYRLWLIASLVLLTVSLGLLVAAAGVAFVSYTDVPSPLWLVAFGVIAGLGVAGGFGGMFLLLAAAGFRSFREGRRVQVLAPERERKA